MKFYDLFGGIGGFRLGIERAGADTATAEGLRAGGCESVDSVNGGSRPLQHHCVGYCDFDRHAVAIYNNRFNEQHEPTDATKLDAKTLPDFGLLCAGFPCQPFSLVGKRLGFADSRGNLFFEILRIAKEKRPGYLLLENVAGLLWHNDGETFASMLEALGEVGYDAEWQVLDSQDFGVPQHRERVFIVGHLRGERTRQVFPVTGSDRENPVVSTITARYHQHNNTGSFVSVGAEKGVAVDAYNGLKETGLAGSLRQNMHNGGSLVAIPTLTPDRAEKRQNGRRFKEDGEPAFTLTSQDRHGIFNGERIRRLTPTECERLQGFPDGWTAEASDSQRYKMLGNAVTVYVIEAIGRSMLG